MKFKYSLLLYILITSLLVCCTNKKSNSNNLNKQEEYAQLEIDIKRHYFGEVSNDTIITGNFIIKNTGSKELVIKSVKPNCNCTSHYIEKENVELGDSTLIKLILNTKGKYGEINVNAIVSTNTKTKFYNLTMKAIVKE